jgi:Ni/Fe-hydrogenase subunit HybB-like protein
MSRPSPRLPSRRVLPWLLFPLAGLGVLAYGAQYRNGLGVTGLAREAPWGLYISQFTFLVGIGASAVTVLLPYYVHRQKTFARALLLGEVIAVIALTQAFLCVLVDLGQPTRLLNILLYPSPTSLMFWDCLTLGGYLTLSAVGLGGLWFAGDRTPAPWVRGLALATIPWAIGIHVVTALLYAGLAARPAWMTAVLAPRFLATAFASGPALLILAAAGLARAKVFDVGADALARLRVIMTYAALASLLLGLLEAFTALYSGIPAAGEHLAYLFRGLDGHTGLVAVTYTSALLLLAALAVLLIPDLRRRRGLELAATAAVLGSVLLEKGLTLVTSGFVPSPLGYVSDYRPSLIELGIVVGIYAGGALAFLGACRFLFVGAVHESSLPSESHAFEQFTLTAREPGMAGAAQMEK